MEAIENLSKLKVAELKKELKARGLPITGNKTELVERLQEAFLENGSGAVEATDELEEFDEEEILGGGEEDEEITKITPQEEEAVLAGTLKVKNDSLLISNSGGEKKKVVLNRCDPPSLEAPLTVEPSTKEEDTPAPAADTSETPATNDDNNKENSHDPQPQRKVIKLSSSSGLDSADDRAKRFGMTESTTQDTAKQTRAARFGTGNAKLSMETGGIDLEKLKKRAERFGEVTSKSLSKLELEEKKKQRMERFKEGSSNGTSTANKSIKVAITAPGDDSEEDLKRKKRMERFSTE